MGTVVNPNPPIYQAMVADAVEFSLAASRRARSVPSRTRHTVRSVQIEAGVCPPWRTDPTIPVGYDGVEFRTDLLDEETARHVRSVIDDSLANLPWWMGRTP